MKITAMSASAHSQPSKGWPKVDTVWLLFGATLLALTIFARDAVIPSLQSMLSNLGHTGIFIAIAVLLIAYLRATGAEALVGKAFQGRESRMIVLAALVGGLAPFCSCEVIPFIAALLAMGTPLSAVMAFWLSSPIMDPAMFVITSSALGVSFAVAKTIAAVGFGLFGGFTVMLMTRSALFNDPLRVMAPASCGTCCGSEESLTGETVWSFWKDPDRLQTFKTTALENALFLFKWLAFAYLLEAIMIRFVPAAWIASTLGGTGFSPILLGSLLGGPAYLNGYAAVPLVQGLIDQGMSQGAAMSFMMAGSVTCIPAAIAVWALVKPRVFMAYLGFAFVGSLIAGSIWAVVN
jgi:uncharacterized membrane protein YraQ (UPF0718 family)